MLHSKTLTDLFDPVKTELKLTLESLYQNLSSDNALINRIISYVLSTGGKNIRPAISLLCSRLLTEKLDSRHFTVAQTVEIIHTATLLHDDVIDDALLRRGNKTVRAIWDNKISVITGDYLLARASGLISTLENVEIVGIFATVLEEICKGEIQQTNLMFDTTINLSEYSLKSTRKTAMLFSAATQGSAIICGADKKVTRALRDYGLNYGLAFQVVDDILNFSTTDQVGKPTCDDLRNGILTAPVIYAIEEYPELAAVIDKRFEDDSNLEKAIEIINNSSGIEKSKSLAELHVEHAIKTLEVFDPSDVKNSLSQLAEYVIQRKY